MNPRFGSEIVRLLTVLSFFTITVVMMMFAQIVSDMLFDRYVKSVFKISTMKKVSQLEQIGNEYAIEPLHDLMFTLLPNCSEYRSWLPDCLLTPLIGLVVIFTIFLPRNRRIEYQGFVVARRLLAIITILYIFRTITFLMTTVPSPVNNCVPMYVKDNDLRNYLIMIGRMASGKVTACTDNIYSGHTTLITVMVLASIHYSGSKLIKIYSVLHGVLAITSIILTRLHYSVDVIIALLLASFVYVGYHSILAIYIDTCVMRDQLTISSHPNFYEERRLLLRVISLQIMKLLAWMDGVDLRDP